MYCVYNIYGKSQTSTGNHKCMMCRSAGRPDAQQIRGAPMSYWPSRRLDTRFVFGTCGSPIICLDSSFLLFCLARLVLFLIVGNVGNLMIMI